MARTLFESNRSAQLLLEQAESLCKVPLKTIMMDGPLDDLTKPSIAQPAILTTSLAYYYSSNESNRRHDCCKVMLGHSLGEYTALCTAGALEFSQAVLLVWVFQ